MSKNPELWLRSVCPRFRSTAEYWVTICAISASVAGSRRNDLLKKPVFPSCFYRFWRMAEERLRSTRS